LRRKDLPRKGGNTTTPKNQRRGKEKDVVGIKTMRGVISNPNTTKPVPRRGRSAGGKPDNNNSNKPLLYYAAYNRYRYRQQTVLDMTQVKPTKMG
jgi:hypothetical protein